jgi:hypothetical protein
MREWWVSYYSTAATNAALEHHKPGREPDLEEFAGVALDGHIGGRDFIKMWIVEPGSEHRHIVAYCGSAPPAMMLFKGGGIVTDLTKHFPMTDRPSKGKPRW